MGLLFFRRAVVCRFPAKTLNPCFERLYTTLWLVLNDVIVGLALASLLAEYDVTLASHLERVIQVRAWISLLC